MFRKSLEDALRDNNPKVLIDLRKQEDYRKETIPGAVNVYHNVIFIMCMWESTKCGRESIFGEHSRKSGNCYRN